MPCVAHACLGCVRRVRLAKPAVHPSLYLAASGGQASERLVEVLGRAAAALPAAEPLWRQRLSRALALELPLTALLEAEVHPHC